jgi:putative membrane protein
MVAIPFIRQYLGERLFLQGLTLLVLFLVLFVLQVLYRAWGWWFLLRVAVGVALLAWAAEAIGIRSGYPFGSYRFTASLQPQVMGVPFLVPLMWLMMLPPAWAMARLITRKLGGCLVRPLFVLTSAFAFTAWDFYLEPLMIHWGLVEWTTPAGYMGIPWSNFLGRILVAGLISLAISPKRLPSGSLVLIYTLTWLVEFICQLLLGLPGSAMVGFLLMGIMVLCAVLFFS